MTASRGATHPITAERPGADAVHYRLTLFVSGASELSARAIANAKRLCDTHLDGRYRLAVVDVHDEPADALRCQVRAAPTLVKDQPLPVRRVVGDLSDTAKVLLALDVPAFQPAPGIPR